MTCMDLSRFFHSYSLSYSDSGPIWLRILPDRSQTIAIAMLLDSMHPCISPFGRPLAVQTAILPFCRPIKQSALPAQP